MMCQRIGRPPTSTIGLGFDSDSSARRVPRPPASKTVFTIPPRADLARVSRRYPTQNVKRLTSRYVPAKRVRATAASLAEQLSELLITEHSFDGIRKQLGRWLLDKLRRALRNLRERRLVHSHHGRSARQRLHERHRE